MMCLPIFPMSRGIIYNFNIRLVSQTGFDFTNTSITITNTPMKSISDYTNMYSLFYKLKQNLYVWLRNCSATGNPLSVHKYQNGKCQCGFELKWYEQFINSR